MCGIAGFYDYGHHINPDHMVPLLTHMTRLMIRRGPDGSGVFACRESGVALGHRRLAVVDLTEAGHQPMTSSCGRFVLTYNGEVFNGDDIRQQLAGRSITFRGHSDTETIVEAIAAWGVLGATEKLIGMFAFAVWDKEKRSLSLVRDRLGIKPLYTAHTPKGFVFGSEMAPLYAHPAIDPDLDPMAVASFLRFGYVGAPQSIDRTIRKQKPGTIQTIDSMGRMRLETYWSVDDMGAQTKEKADEWALSDGETIDQVHDLLIDAVKRRMVADVPLGAFLSGGIDSSLVVALMQKLGDRPVKTFSIGFNEAGFDESPHARAIANHLGTEHHEWIMTADEAQDVVKKLPSLYDEPFADSSQIPTYLVSQFARRHVTVSLSGDGGDELFGGYNRYLLASSLWGKISKIPMALRPMTSACLKKLPTAVLNALSSRIPGCPPQLGNKFLKLADVLAASDENAFYHGLVSQNDQDWVPSLGLSRPRLDRGLDDFSGSLLRRMQLCDLATYLPDDILTKVDRASMAVSLEARVPLLDHRLVELAFSLPDHFKVRRGQTKWLLRQILYQYVPRKLIDRPKMGFGIPLADWLRGGLKSWAEGLIYDRCMDIPYLDMPAIRQTFDRHQKGQIKADYALWCALMFLSWRHHQKHNVGRFDPKNAEGERQNHA